jgi:hypothetical protein
MKMVGINPLPEKDCVIVICDLERRAHMSLTAPLHQKRKTFRLGRKEQIWLRENRTAK